MPRFLGHYGEKKRRPLLKRKKKKGGQGLTLAYQGGEKGKRGGVILPTIAEEKGLKS